MFAPGLIPPTVLKTYMWEAARLPYEDCDKVPLILRSSDNQLESFLAQYAPANIQSAHASRKGLLMSNPQATDVTGKQYFNFLVRYYQVSPHVLVKEAVDALGTFRVQDPDCPFSWEEAFNTYEIKIQIAKATSFDPETKASLLIVSLEHHLSKSREVELSSMQGSLDM